MNDTHSSRRFNTLLVIYLLQSIFQVAVYQAKGCSYCKQKDDMTCKNLTNSMRVNTTNHFVSALFTGVEHLHFAQNIPQNPTTGYLFNSLVFLSNTDIRNEFYVVVQGMHCVPCVRLERIRIRMRVIKRAEKFTEGDYQQNTSLFVVDSISSRVRL